LKVIGERSLNDYIDAIEVWDYPIELLFLPNDVGKVCLDAKFEKGKFSLLTEDVGVVKGTLKNDIGVNVVVDHAKESLVNPNDIEKMCLAVKNEKKKVILLR